MSAAKGTSSVLLLATDFDGTLAPIVTRPQDAAIDGEAVELLRRLLRDSSIAVAVISGRDVEDVRARLDGLPVIVAGSHGLECLAADGTQLWTSPARRPELDPQLREEMTAAGLQIEEKKFSAAAHFRVLNESGIRPLLDRFTDWARRHELEIITGRKVVEARVKGGGKRNALQRIASLLEADRVVYAGDDTTDFQALQWAAQHGRAVFVASEERRPPHLSPLTVVTSVSGVCTALSREAAAWAGYSALRAD